ncbi:hypothetical protein HAX54_005823 [Datura stramonium]|uniref:NPH3 domain-containing protein n=1 Tax=Datura stramonium TaxID=4076 RepID=A0ABS8TAL4_DATST|nr:hypothetical protein [Datura stramonium]
MGVANEDNISVKEQPSRNTEDITDKNLEIRTELNKDTVFLSISNQCLFFTALEHNFPSKPIQSIGYRDSVRLVGENPLIVLNLELFQRGLIVKDPHLAKGSFLDLDLQKKQRSDLERRLVCKSHQAILRIFSYLEMGGKVNHSPLPDLPNKVSILKVSKLLDNYLAEIALDSNLTPSKFTAVAELLPDHARLVDDGLYHKKAAKHAAQNERLPVQMAVQVLYFEQIRLRNAMNRGQNQLFFGSMNSQFPHRSGSGCISPRDNYASVRRENRELKLEVARMRMRLTDLEKDHVSMKQGLVKSHPANKLFKSFTKKLSKLNSMFRRRFKANSGKANSESRFLIFTGKGIIQFLDMPSSV